jgi:hypothetical protein
MKTKLNVSVEEQEDGTMKVNPEIQMRGGTQEELMFCNLMVCIMEVVLMMRPEELSELSVMELLQKAAEQTDVQWHSYSPN